MAKTKTKNNAIPWSVIIDGVIKLGRWNLFENTARRKIFTRRDEKIVAVKLGPNRWKAEYSVNGRLQDTSGMAEEEYIKRILLEMNVHIR